MAETQAPPITNEQPNGGPTIITDPASRGLESANNLTLDAGIKAWRASHAAKGTAAPATETASSTPDAPKTRVVDSSALSVLAALANKPSTSELDSQERIPDTDSAAPVPSVESPDATKEAAGSEGKESPVSQSASPTPDESSASPVTETSQTPPSVEDGAKPSKLKRGELPPEYDVPEWRDRFAADPQVKRQVTRLEHDPSISSTKRALMIAGEIRKSDERIDQAVQQQSEEETLLDTNPFAYTQRVKAQRAAQRESLQTAQAVGRMIAESVGVDADDHEFLAAGPIEGESHEEGLRKFARYLVEKAPLVQDYVAERLQAKDTATSTQVQQVKQEYETRLKALETSHKTALENAHAQGLAEGRGVTVAAPRNGNGASQVVGDTGPYIPNTLSIRSLLAAGVRGRQEASADRASTG